MATSRAQLQRWFITGAKPTQEQFSQVFQSFFHLEEDTLPLSKIEGLESLLAQFAGLSADEVAALIAAHNDDSASHNIGTIDDFTAQFGD